MSEEKKEEILEQENNQHEEDIKEDLVQEEQEENLEDKVLRLENELKLSNEKFLRTYADFDNMKKRLEKEKYQAIDYASEKFAKDLLVPLDSLEMALNSTKADIDVNELLSKLKEGIELTLKNFITTFEKHNIKKIDIDGEFDPNIHNAVMQVDSSDHTSGQIVSELQKGYLLKDRLLRPSMVSIAN